MWVDAHVHLASADRDRFPLRPSGVGSSWWREPVDADAFVRELDGASVGRAVVVQAVGAYGYDNAYLLEAVAARPERFVGIVAVDLDGDDWERSLDDLLARPGIVGVRCFAVGRPAPVWPDDPGLVRAVFAVVHHHRSTVVLTAFERQLAGMLPALDAEPAVPVAIDHCGFPDWATPEPSPVERLVAERPQVHLKLSGHNLREAGDGRAAFDRAARLVGAERVLAGSDYPQTDGSYADRWADLRRACGDHPGCLGTNALRLWWGPAPPDGPVPQG